MIDTLRRPILRSRQKPSRSQSLALAVDHRVFGNQHAFLLFTSNSQQIALQEKEGIYIYVA